MSFTILLSIAAFALLTLFGVYQLFAPKPDHVDDPDSRFGPGPDDCVGGGD
jgi:hypothetical protein